MTNEESTIDPVEETPIEAVAAVAPEPAVAAGAESPVSTSPAADLTQVPPAEARNRKIANDLAFACGMKTGTAFEKYTAMSDELKAEVNTIIDAGGKSSSALLRQCMVKHSADAAKASVEGVND